MRLHAVVVLLLIAADAVAQNQGSPTFNGIIVGAAEDRSSFSFVDRTGAVIKMAVGPGTSYQSNKVEVNSSEVVRFGMEIRGTFAPDGSAAQVTARGIIDQLNVAQMQAFMGIPDDEWGILKPRIERIQALRRIAESRASNSGGNNGNNGGNGNGNANSPPPPRNPVQELQRNLNSAFFGQSASIAQLKNGLANLRETQARAREELAIERKRLVDLITTRQEVLLVVMGILE